MSTPGSPRSTRPARPHRHLTVTGVNHEPTPRISVALCTFNSERFLGEQLESVINQTLPVTEIVLADDGSTDGTRGLVERFASTHDVVRVLSWERIGGVAKNFSRTLAACEGSVVLLCDHDDVWRADKVEILARALTPGTISLVFSDARIIDAASAQTATSLFQSLRLTTGERAQIRAGDALGVLVRRNVVTGATVAATRELIEAALPVADGWVHDEWLAAVAAALGTVTMLEDTPTDYRIHGANQIGVTSPSARARVRRMWASSPDRFALQHQRFVALRDAVGALGASPGSMAVISAKIAFESYRSTYSRIRFLRVFPVLKALLRGHYGRFASQGLLDAIRDIVVR